MSGLKQQLMGGALAVPHEVIPVPAPAAPQGPPVRVMIAIPSGRSWEARTSTAVAGLATYTALHGKNIGILSYEGSMITKSRNELAQMAMAQGFDYLCQIDSDMVMPPDSLMRLLAHNKDIVGATYNKRVPPYETLGRFTGDPVPLEEMMKGGLRQADELPGGMMLVKTDVFRRMRWPWYFESYQWEGENGVDALKGYLRKNFKETPPQDVLDDIQDSGALATWLNRMYDVHGGLKWEYCSEDLNFCRNARKAGFRIWCDLSLTFQMVHLGVLEVTCKPPANQAPSAVVDAVM